MSLRLEGGFVDPVCTTHARRGYPRVELIVVMVLVPLFVNILQFWIQVRALCLGLPHANAVAVAAVVRRTTS